MYGFQVRKGTSEVLGSVVSVPEISDGVFYVAVVWDDLSISTEQVSNLCCIGAEEPPLAFTPKEGGGDNKVVPINLRPTDTDGV